VKANVKIHQKFLLVLLVTISAVRVWAISLYYLLNKDFLNKIINDQFHHYQVGLLLLLAVYPLRKLIKPFILSAVGLGIILEEWPISLADLGFGTKKYYHTKIDFILIFGLVLLLYMLLFLHKNKRHGKQ